MLFVPMLLIGVVIFLAWLRSEITATRLTRIALTRISLGLLAMIFACIMFLVSMIVCGTVRAAEAQPEEKESETAISVSKEEPSDKYGVITNTIGMKLKPIEAGEFMMGSEKVVFTRSRPTR